MSFSFYYAYADRVHCMHIINSNANRLYRFGHGSDFAKLASSNQEEQTDYVVGVSPN